MTGCDLKFHRSIGFPDSLLLPEGEYPITKTSHAKERSNVNEYGSFALPDTIEFSRRDIVEVKVRDKQVWRILIRQSYNSEFDVCYVLEFPDYTLVTSWRNHKHDTRETVDKRDYNHPNEFLNYIRS